MKKIDKIKIVHTMDDDPDLSWLGEYTEKLTDGVIVRHFGKFYQDLTEEEIEEIPGRSNEYRGFIPADSGEKPDSPNYKKYALENYSRMEDINNGNVGFYGISAEAKVLTQYPGSDHWLINTLSSGGLWGIESDSDPSYFEEIEKEQLEELKDVLKEYGFSEDEINKSFENIVNDN
jgi:hypothetical protein